MAETPSPEGLRLGGKVRALRRREQLSQVQLAERLGISPSYLNLIEAERRPLPAALLIKLAQVFEPYGLAAPELRELATATPSLARAVLALYRAYRSQQQSTESLASQIVAGEEGIGGVDRAQLPSEEVNDLVFRSTTT